MPIPARRPVVSPPVPTDVEVLAAWIPEQSAETLAHCLTADPRTELRLGILHGASTMTARLLAALLSAGARADELWAPRDPRPWAGHLSPAVYLTGASRALLRGRTVRRWADGTPRVSMRAIEDREALILLHLAVTALARTHGTPVPLTPTLRLVVTRFADLPPTGRAPSSEVHLATRVLLAAGHVRLPPATAHALDWLPARADIEHLMRLPGVTHAHLQSALDLLLAEYRVAPHPTQRRLLGRSALALLAPELGARRRALLATPAGAAMWQIAITWGLCPIPPALQRTDAFDLPGLFDSSAWARVIAHATLADLTAMRAAWLAAADTLTVDQRTTWRLLAQRYRRAGMLSSRDLAHLLLSRSACTRETVALTLLSTSAPRARGALAARRPTRPTTPRSPRGASAR